MTKKIIAPGSWIGMLGGGQLGRMAALAAAEMGYHVHVLAPEKDSPAFEVSARQTLASYDDEKALFSFASSVDIVTCEFENVPAQTLAFLQPHVTVRPSPQIFSICQDRIEEKNFLSSIAIPVTPYKDVARQEDLKAAAAEIGYPCILKSTRFGYDGKGQVRLNSADDLPSAWSIMGSNHGILERAVNFTKEISVIAARNPDGAIALYEPVENQHRHHILDTTIVPAIIPPAISHQAQKVAQQIVIALELEGLIAVEMFVTTEQEVLVNELAPRPHNSGHWSMDAACTGQFEQFIRAICNLPLGSTSRMCDAIMTNLLGDDGQAWHRHLADPWSKLHLYGKSEARPGRKMGHVTRLLPRQDND